MEAGGIMVSDSFVPYKYLLWHLRKQVVRTSIRIAEVFGCKTEISGSGCARTVEVFERYNNGGVGIYANVYIVPYLIASAYTLYVK